MARIYSPTRNILDANTMMSAMRNSRERDDERNRMIASGIANILRGGQKAVERSNRKAIFENDWDAPVNDKEYEVAKETFINTGDVSALNAYKQRKLQEREQKMREDDIATRKKLADIENRKGAEVASKERESQIDELMTNLKKALVQVNSESVTPDVRSIAGIDVAYYRKRLKDLGVELSDDDIVTIGGGQGKTETKTETETETEVKESEPKEETFYDKVMKESDLSARKRKLKERIAELRKGATDAEKAELSDIVKRVGDATEGAKRDDEFLSLTGEVEKLVTKEDRYKYRKGLADKYESLLASPARMAKWQRDNKEEFEKAKKAHDEFYK